MNKIERENLNTELTLRHKLLRLRAGFQVLRQSNFKKLILISYFLLLAILWLLRNPIFKIEKGALLAPFMTAMLGLTIFLFAIIGPFLIISLMGTPIGAARVSNDLRRAGVVNHAGEAPLLLARYKANGNPKVTVLEFESSGISRAMWEDKRAKIETALNVHIAHIKDGADRRKILLHTVNAGAGLPSILHWQDKYLNKGNFVLALGESLPGTVEVNLAHIPHMLLGGATGSGKSVLLKLLLMQCLQKGAIVSIADFKGGVDFPKIWHEKCRMCFDEADLLELLSGIVDELERRKVVLSDSGHPNIDEYNNVTGAGLPRLIFACDEVAELLDKNGRTKEDKELISKIENKLSVIARQGRALGVHMILSTQRPDATILSGQIRSNIDCRVCGRADNVLSQIILDNTDASELIPKDARGRFLLHDGTIFQSYMFDEESL